MNQLIVLFLVIIGSMSVIFATIYFSQEWKAAEAKDTAQKILDFRNTEHSCSELKQLYMKYHPKYLSGSWDDYNWYHEVRDRFISNGCVSKTQLDNLEFIEMCSDSHVTGCEISKLKYPEAYDNFNFQNSINNLNSTQWKKLGDRR